MIKSVRKATLNGENWRVARLFGRAWGLFALDVVGLVRAYFVAAQAFSSRFSRQGVIRSCVVIFGLLAKRPGRSMFLGQLSNEVIRRLKTFSIYENVTEGVFSFLLPRYYFFEKEITNNYGGGKGRGPGLLLVISRLFHGYLTLCTHKMCYAARVLQLRNPLSHSVTPRGGVG